jgi:hypothetical protein
VKGKYKNCNCLKRVKLTISILQGWGLAKGQGEMEQASGDDRQEAEVEE